MSFLLDTSALSELVKPSPNPGLIAWLAATDEDRLFISVLTIGELVKGVAKLSGGAKRLRLQFWLERDLAARFSGRTLVIDEPIGNCWGKMQAAAEKRGRPLPVIDSLIAATASVRSLVIVSRNVNDFKRTGVATIDPWSQ